jgi:hypothetical protein
MNKLSTYGLGLMVLASLIACSRESGFLQTLPKPFVPQATQPPATLPTPTPMPGAVHHNGTYILKVESTSEFIPEVDVLWIIDNSGSMNPHQQRVIANTQVFMQNFTSQTRLKWKMGLISTSQFEPPYLGFAAGDELDYKTVNPVLKFQTAVGRLGTQGDDAERVYTPILSHLKANPTFLNPKAYLALVIVTDEEEQSTEPPLNLPMSGQKFITELAKLKNGDKDKIVSFGVFQTAEKCGSGFLYATSRYRGLIQGTNGKTYSLCDPQFGQVLSNMGADLIKTLTTMHPIITLDQRPIPWTIKVTYKGRELKFGFKEDGGEWIYDPISNTIRITDLTVIDPKEPDVKIDFDLDPEYYPEQP